jgi:hypothetical protein
VTSGINTDDAQNGGPLERDDEIPADEQPPDRDGDDSIEETVGQGPPDVLLDVHNLSVDEITLEVEDLEAHVSLRAEVLELLKLNVGADVTLGRVSLKITGVKAQVLLKVRLDRVAQIIDRVLTTIDNNPQILEQVVRTVEPALNDVSSAVGEIGTGGGRAAEELGRGAGEAVGEVGHGAGDAVEQVGGVADDVGLTREPDDEPARRS